MKKRIINVLISVFISIFVALNIGLGIAASKYDTYIIKMEDGDQLEAVIINDTEMPIDRYVSEWTVLEENAKPDVVRVLVPFTLKFLNVEPYWKL